MNLITPAKRKQSVALVKTGETVSLAHTLLTEKADDNASPCGHTRLRGRISRRSATPPSGMNRWQVMLTINPMPVTAGAGFPLNAVAMF